jgi:hypothetical protein
LAAQYKYQRISKTQIFFVVVPNTAGMAGINACGDIKPLVDASQTVQVDEISLKQEATDL